MSEAKIKIGRYRLNAEQSLVVRISLNVFLEEVDADEELKEMDEEQRKQYRRRIEEIKEMLQLTIREKKYAKS